MKRAVCQRLWQIEAARDGRLASSDLSNALRHRAECSDCAQAARALSELGRKLKALPVQPTEALARRRTRQALLGAWNQHLLGEPPSKFGSRAGPFVAICAVAGAALAVGYPLVRGTSQSSGTAVVQPKSPPGFAAQAPAPSRAEPSSAPQSPPQATATESALAKSQPSSAALKTRSARNQGTRAAAASTTDSAEDNAYLQIVELLRNGHELEARAKAAQYLALFPNGFRRPEVERVAKRPLENK